MSKLTATHQPRHVIANSGEHQQGVLDNLQTLLTERHIGEYHINDTLGIFTIVGVRNMGTITWVLLYPGGDILDLARIRVSEYNRPFVTLHHQTFTQLEALLKQTQSLQVYRWKDNVLLVLKECGELLFVYHYWQTPAGHREARLRFIPRFFVAMFQQTGSIYPEILYEAPLHEPVIDLETGSVVYHRKDYWVKPHDRYPHKTPVYLYRCDCGRVILDEDAPEDCHCDEPHWQPMKERVHD